MKILLDECVTKRIESFLQEFEVFAVRELKLSGVTNGKLMTYCVENKFDILLTIDKNLMHQHSIEKYPITSVVFNCITSKIDELITFLPSFRLQVDTLQKHKVYIINN